jgi:4-amino-4-deoxy-L-arabinose transferase-like glycosyltransferase
LAAGLIAFNPQFLFISALVTNDALLTALSAILTWLIVRADDGWRVWDAAAIGIVLGLALLTKQSAIILIPVALIGSVAWPRRGVPSLRRSALAAIVMLAAAVAIAGWWYARNQRLYGDLFGLGAFRGEFVTQSFEIGSPAAWGAALAQLHASFWARFGWMNVAPPAWVLWLIGAAELAAVAGLAREWLWGGRPRGDLLAIYWPLLALPALAFAWIVSFAVTAGLVAWQGRLLFLALPAIAILLARGLLAWYVVTKGEDDRSLSAARPGTRRVSLVAGLVLSPVVGLALWMPGGVIGPAYPQQTLPEAAAQQQLGTPVLARFRQRGERSVTLRGWRLEGPAQPGATIDLTLMWYASSRQTRDWVVFVHLLDAQDRTIVESNRQPRGGVFPNTQWNMGDWIEDQHQIRLPADLAEGVYRLRIGLYDQRDQRRAGVYALGGAQIGDAFDLGSITIRKT